MAQWLKNIWSIHSVAAQLLANPLASGCAVQKPPMFGLEHILKRYGFDTIRIVHHSCMASSRPDTSLEVSLDWKMLYFFRKDYMPIRQY